MNDISSNIAHESPDAIVNRLMWKAHSRDGSAEIAAGVYCLVLAGLNALPMAFPLQHRSPIQKPFLLGLWLVLLLLLITLPIGSRWAIKQVRQRFLIEKLGYVKLKPVNRKLIRLTIVSGFVAGAVGAVVSCWFIRMFWLHPYSICWGMFSPAGWMLAGCGIFGGVGAALIGRRTRHFIGGTAMAATGILLAIGRVSLTMGLTILYGFVGLLSLVSGCVVLLLFLRQPAGAEE